MNKKNKATKSSVGLGTLYDLNKMVMDNFKPLTELEIAKKQ